MSEDWSELESVSDQNAIVRKPAPSLKAAKARSENMKKFIALGSGKSKKNHNFGGRADVGLRKFSFEDDQ